MSQTCHMYTNLMRTTCFQTTFNIRSLTETLQDFIMCNCLFSIFMVDRHLLTIDRMTPDRCVYSPFIFFDISLNNCTISSFNTVFLKLFCKVSVHHIILTDQKSPRSVFIDTMNDTRTHNSIDSGEIISTMCHYSINQRSLHMSCTWMYDHVFRLIYNHKPLILIQNIQRNVLRLYIRCLQIRDI